MNKLSPLDRSMLRETVCYGYLKGNMTAFGRWKGFVATLTLVSPLLNHVINFSARNKYLKLDIENELVENAWINKLDEPR